MIEKLINIHMIEVIDDFVSQAYQEEIKKILLGHRFPWYFEDDITFGKDLMDSSDLGESHPAHSHLFCRNKTSTSPYFDFVIPIAQQAVSCLGLKFYDIIQCRSFLQYPLNLNFIKSGVDKLHIDLTYDHLVVLYYVIDADGDTVIVDKIREGNTEEFHHKLEDHKEIKRVTPKQGRAIVFDGKYYHTAFQPSKSMRCVINFNVV
jgi:hypothetical protein